MQRAKDEHLTAYRDPRNPDVWLVTSHTYPNVRYKVRHRQSCGCEYFHHKREYCKHLILVSWLMHQERKEAAA